MEMITGTSVIVCWIIHLSCCWLLFCVVVLNGWVRLRYRSPVWPLLECLVTWMTVSACPWETISSDFVMSTANLFSSGSLFVWLAAVYTLSQRSSTPAHIDNFDNSQRIFKIFHSQTLWKICSKTMLKIPPHPLIVSTLRCSQTYIQCAVTHCLELFSQSHIHQCLKASSQVLCTSNFSAEIL